MMKSLALCVCMATVTAAAAAQEMQVPVATQIQLFLKVLTFDRQMRSRAGTEVVVGVAYQSGSRASAIAGDVALRALGLAHDSVDGLPVRAVAIDLDNEALAGALAKYRVAVLYVAPLRGVDVASIASAARAAHVMTMTGVPDYVARGLSVGVRLQRDRPKLLVNLTASKLEGSDLSAELLKLAVVTQ
jgi:hypothetical protein